MRTGVYDSVIADRLKKLRVERGLSQIELSEKAGVHPVTLCKWEKGLADGIRVRSLLKLADALDCTPNDLLGVEIKKIAAHSGRRGDGEEIMAMNAEIRIYGDMGRFVIIKTPFDFSLSSEEAAEILREFWERTIIPIQAGLQRSSWTTVKPVDTKCNINI